MARNATLMTMCTPLAFQVTSGCHIVIEAIFITIRLNIGFL